MQRQEGAANSTQMEYRIQGAEKWERPVEARSALDKGLVQLDKELSFKQRSKGLASNFCLRKALLNAIKRADGGGKTEDNELVRGLSN